MIDDRSCSKICSCSFGLAVGIVNAIGVMLLAIISMHYPYGTDMVHEIASVYHGYAASYMGAVYGGIWALVEGFVFGSLVAVFYNCFSRCCCRKKEM